MENKDLISIIVPVYNVENYLERCINSILIQTYKNIEILLIDDGSTDNSGNICKKIAKLDSRVRYYYKKNSGVADTRNFGLNVSSGKYITFIDSDDCVSEQYIEFLHTALIEHDADVSICTFEKFYKTPNILTFKSIENKNIYNTEESLFHFLLQDTIYSSFWGKMYTKVVFKNIVISNYKVFEDMDTIYRILLKSKKIICISNQLYYYFVRRDSLIHKKFSDENAKVLQILDNMGKIIFQEFPNLREAFLIRKINAHFYIVRNVEKKSLLYKESTKFIINNRKRILKIKYIPLKTKIGIYLSFINIDLIKQIFKVYDRLR